MAPSWKRRSNLVKQPVTGPEGKAAADKPAADPARAPFAEALAMNPLMAQSAAAMATATAVGLTITSQFASAFFGALQSALETSKRLNSAQETSGVAAPPEKTAQTPAEPAPAPKPRAPRQKTAGAPAAKVAKARTEPKAQPKRTAKAKPASKPAAGAKTEDLKKIKGIGPKLEQVLQENGVSRVAQIASWSEDDIAKFDEALGLDGRIGRDDWVGQARKLAE